MEKVIADLHLHSKYSRAVSRQMDFVHMASWATQKAIDVLGTGDFTHPLWLRELEAGLEETEEGVYGLKEPILQGPTLRNARSDLKQIKFILTAEISSIYSQGGRLRRIHNILLAPNLETVKKINNQLRTRGTNLMADGRPIIGLSAIDLCELVWSVNKDILVIPAHIWTPYFSMFGSKSGFDSIEECFGDFADRIFAIETGLSSDPAMNWRIRELDNRTIVSFSDAHSPAKLGREATVFELRNNFGYKDLYQAIQNTRNTQRARKSDKSDKSESGSLVLSDLSDRSEFSEFSENRILYTIEFYPQEGKYHYTGHRSCQVVQSPEETRQKGTKCPVCGKPLIIGVMHRVEQLANGRQVQLTKKVNKAGVQGVYHANQPLKPPFVMLVPLLEILAESLASTPTSQKVLELYRRLTEKFEGEFGVLLEISQEGLALIAGPKVAAGIDRVRKGEIVIKPGFDGVFGQVSIWGGKEEKSPLAKEQMSLF